jgi:hypothetical protein
MPLGANDMQMLKTIKSFLERCASERMNGELVLRLSFCQGGVRNMVVERKEILDQNGKGQGRS